MNHMAEVAKMLGVELGEVFEILEYPSKKFMITNCGIGRLESGEWSYDVAVNSFVFEKLLTGKYNIKRKPWKPKDGDIYWYVDEHGNALVNGFYDKNALYHMNYYKLGNCYRTCEEAEANRDKWVAFYASDEVLEV